MKKIERQKKILEILSKVPLTTISELSEILNVSTETIRKDLITLSSEDKIIQTHGGVALKIKRNKSQPFDYRMKISSHSKKVVAKKAITLIEKDDIVLLESSTTSLALVNELCKNKELLSSLVIVTSSFKIAALIDECFNEDEKKCKLFFIGGWMDFSQHSTSGMYVLDTLKEIHISKSFISVAAIDEMLNLSGYSEEDVFFQKIAIQQASTVILMVEKSKYSRKAMFRVGNLSEVDYLVTDIQLDDHIAKIARDSNVVIISANE